MLVIECMFVCVYVFVCVYNYIIFKDIKFRIPWIDMIFIRKYSRGSSFPVEESETSQHLRRVTGRNYEKNMG
jgi:hypothetical protein